MTLGLEVCIYFLCGLLAGYAYGKYHDWRRRS